MAQSVKHPTLDFSSCHDVIVGEFEPHIGLCTNSMEPVGILSLSSYLSSASPLALSLFLKINALKKKKEDVAMSCTA